MVPALSGILVPRTIRPETDNAWYQRLYVPSLKWALSHRAITLVAAVVLFAASLALVPVIGTSFMPSMGMKEIMVEVEMPLGTDIKATDARTLEVEQAIKRVMESRGTIDVFYAVVGTSSSFSGGFTALTGGGGSNTASIEVVMATDADLNREAGILEEELAAIGGEGRVTRNAAVLGHGFV